MSKVGKERVPAGPGGSCLDTTHCPGASPSLGFPSWSQFPSLSNAAEGLPASDLEPRRNAAQPTEPLRLRTPAAGEPPEGQPAGQARSGPRGCARLIPALRPRLDTPRRCYGSAVPPPAPPRRAERRTWLRGLPRQPGVPPPGEARTGRGLQRRGSCPPGAGGRTQVVPGRPRAPARFEALQYLPNCACPLRHSRIPAPGAPTQGEG